MPSRKLAVRRDVNTLAQLCECFQKPDYYIYIHLKCTVKNGYSKTRVYTHLFKCQSIDTLARRFSKRTFMLFSINTMRHLFSNIISVQFIISEILNNNTFIISFKHCYAGLLAVVS